MTAFFIILNIMWIASVIGFIFNVYNLTQEYKQEEIDFFRIVIFEIRCNHNLTTMWISVIGIILLILNK